MIKYHYVPFIVFVKSHARDDIYTIKLLRDLMINDLRFMPLPPEFRILVYSANAPTRILGNIIYSEE